MLLHPEVVLVLFTLWQIIYGPGRLFSAESQVNMFWSINRWPLRSAGTALRVEETASAPKQGVSATTWSVLNIIILLPLERLVRHRRCGQIMMVSPPPPETQVTRAKDSYGLGSG